MGCQVRLSTEQPYFRTDSVKSVVLLHILRGVLFLSVSLVVGDLFAAPLAIGLVELFLAYWFWTLRIEAWGLSLGMVLFQLLYPSLWSISILLGAVALLLSLLQAIVLALVRREGGYSFNQIYSVDTLESRPVGAVQNRMLQIAVLAQTMKAVTVLFGAALVIAYESVFPSTPWLGLLPIGPFAMTLGAIDLVAAIQLFRGIDWGFHLTLLMVPLSVLETILTFQAPVLLIGIWIAMLMAPCWVKDGFYAKMFSRLRSPRGAS